MKLAVLRQDPTATGGHAGRCKISGFPTDFLKQLLRLEGMYGSELPQSWPLLLHALTTGLPTNGELQQNYVSACRKGPSPNMTEVKQPLDSWGRSQTAA